jgi:hypothetical protein
MPLPSCKTQDAGVLITHPIKPQALSTVPLDAPDILKIAVVVQADSSHTNLCWGVFLLVQQQVLLLFPHRAAPLNRSVPHIVTSPNHLFLLLFMKTIASCCIVIVPLLATILTSLRMTGDDNCFLQRCDSP